MVFGQKGCRLEPQKRVGTGSETVMWILVNRPGLEVPILEKGGGKPLSSEFKGLLFLKGRKISGRFV